MSLTESYQEKIQGVVKGAALELCASFGLRAEGNIGVFMAVLIPFAEGGEVGAQGKYTDVLQPWESLSGHWQLPSQRM